MSTELPPLPPCPFDPPQSYSAAAMAEWTRQVNAWADQTRAYARAAVEAEREACARLCDEMAEDHTERGAKALEGAAHAIRQRGKQ